MQQLEIQYFFPLTEQIPLDLDYSQCNPHQYWIRAQGIAGVHGPFPVGMTFVGDSQITNTTVLSGWDIGKKEEPSRLRKFLMKHLIGWKWIG